MNWSEEECVYEDVTCDKMFDMPVHLDTIMTWKYVPKLAYSSATQVKLNTFPSQKEYIH